MENIIVFGAGKSSIFLIEYLKKICTKQFYNLVIIDINEKLAQEKLGNFENGRTCSFSIENDQARNESIKDAKVVISLLPAYLHILVATSCLHYKKPLFTASYIEPQIESLADQIKENGLVFLYEIGLDPGIDHLSACKLINTIKSQGGKINSFRSHCGGLVAPQSDNNPWHYKISWNPKNIINAGGQGAKFLSNGNIINYDYSQVFNNYGQVQLPEGSSFSYYFNRDSLNYIKSYELQDCKTFIRTTLRHPDFCRAWAFIVLIGLTSNEEMVPIQTFNNVSEWLHQKITTHDAYKKIKEDPILKKMFDYLTDSNLILNPQHEISSAELFQMALEKLWQLNDQDMDRVVMIHEIEYELKNQQFYVQSALDLNGDNADRTAMAKTVGLPLAMAVEMYLENKIDTVGLQIPISEIYYQYILPKLQLYGIEFKEWTRQQ